jgi:hypothetical protein
VNETYEENDTTTHADNVVNAQWGWEAFEVNATGAAVIAANLTEAVVYQQLGNASEGCVKDLQIASQDECRQAIESLGMSVSDTWSGTSADVPRYCSADVSDPNNTIAMFNSAPPNTTQGRSGVTPICLTGPKPQGCPACVSSKRIIPAVVIPFYERDLCKFVFTARSLSVNDPNHFLGDIYFLWTSYSSPAGYWSTIQGIIDEVNQTHTVHFYDFSGVVRGGGQPGWIAQQIMKLKIASVITSDYYLVLDSKNTLIKEMQSDTLVSSCNQAITFAAYTPWSLPNPHKSWYFRTAAKLGVPFGSAAGLWPDSITPKTMYTKTVIDMLHAVGEDPNPGALCRGPLCGWFKGQGATEFILYELFSHFRTDFQCNHVTRNVRESPIAGDLWRGRASLDIIRWASEQTFFGAQSGSFNGIGGWQRTQASSHIRNVFINARLVNESDPTATPEFFMGCLG